MGLLFRAVLWKPTVRIDFVGMLGAWKGYIPCLRDDYVVKGGIGLAEACKANLDHHGYRSILTEG